MVQKETAARHIVLSLGFTSSDNIENAITPCRSRDVTKEDDKERPAYGGQPMTHHRHKNSRTYEGPRRTRCDVTPDDAR